MVCPRCNEIIDAPAGLCPKCGAIINPQYDVLAEEGFDRPSQNVGGFGMVGDGDPNQRYYHNPNWRDNSDTKISGGCLLTIIFSVILVFGLGIWGVFHFLIPWISNLP